MGNLNFISGKGLPSTGEAQGIRERKPSEAIHLNSPCTVCGASGVWTDREDWYNDHPARCTQA